MDITNRYTTTSQVSYNTGAKQIKVGTIPGVLGSRHIVITGFTNDSKEEVQTYIKGRPAQLRALADAANHLASSMEMNGEESYP